MSEKIPNQESLVLAERIETAKSALADFMKLKPEEAVLFLHDDGTDPETLNILKSAASQIGSTIVEIDLRKRKNKIASEEFENKAIIDLSEDENDFTSEIYEKIKETKSRMASLGDLGPEVFERDGPMSEKLEDLQYRLDKMESVLKEAVGFKITSVYGTNLEVPLRQAHERQWYKDAGVIEKGKWDNLPGGEIFTTPDQEKVRGTLVLPILESEISPQQGVDEFVRLEIRDGLIISIQGGKSAEKLQKYLARDVKDEIKEQKQEFKENGELKEKGKSRNPGNIYRIAEIAFGANSKARNVSDPKKSYRKKGVSVVEAEKKLGTMHLAFGDSRHDEEGTEGNSAVVPHHDFVVPRNGLTVEMFVREDDFEKSSNGRKIISEGGLNFF
ncbi:MAG: aminopeptidase [Candidatus Portnoybacteria bacterium]|nr:aminopeptidase [Candidatus Portnoybacteria bacterium]